MKKTIKIYDFDHTIYRGNSSIDFYLFCLIIKPHILIFLPYQIWHIILYILRIEDKTSMKSHLFIFLRGVKNLDFILKKFWDKKFKKMKKWYVLKDHSKDVIISASPVFLLQPVSKKLKIHKLIATIHNIENGKIIGKNCFGEEKVKRLQNSMKNYDAVEAYSDHLSDLPMLKIAQKRYIVKGNDIISFEDYKKNR